MPAFRKRPVVVEGVQVFDEFVVDTLEGRMTGQPGDWLLTGVAGEQYACADAIFRATYEAVDTDGACALANPGAEFFGSDGEEGT